MKCTREQPTGFFLHLLLCLNEGSLLRLKGSCFCKLSHAGLCSGLFGLAACSTDLLTVYALWLLPALSVLSALIPLNKPNLNLHSHVYAVNVYTTTMDTAGPNGLNQAVTSQCCIVGEQVSETSLINSSS